MTGANRLSEPDYYCCQSRYVSRVTLVWRSKLNLHYRYREKEDDIGKYDPDLAVCRSGHSDIPVVPAKPHAQGIDQPAYFENGDRRGPCRATDSASRNRPQTLHRLHQLRRSMSRARRPSGTRNDQEESAPGWPDQLYRSRRL